MSTPKSDEMTTAVFHARVIVNHLIALTSGAEPAVWLAKYFAVQEALAAGRVEDAIVQHSKMFERYELQWVASRELAKRVREALSNVARLLKLPNEGKTEVRLDDLPRSLDELGTIAEEQQRRSEETWDSLNRDPLELDPSFAHILAAADHQAESELQNHPLKGGTGFCHVYWRTKKRILRQVHGLDWRTPAELNWDIWIDLMVTEPA